MDKIIQWVTCNQDWITPAIAVFGAVLSAWNWLERHLENRKRVVIEVKNVFCFGPEAKTGGYTEVLHYQNALQRINAQLEAASDVDRAAIEEKKAELMAQLDKIDKEFADVDYREANQRAGYVYVISNIGAFGENVYKIGMTRRLDPQDRVDELGDASVPFNFDVHAMIFSNDAPKLEAALHNAFADRKLNFVNQRREFFNVSLDEIKQVIKDNYDKSVEFVELAPAEQYRESLKLKEQAKRQAN